jgi:chromate reductase, NAD(P)H dehydrogenase (quinone)
MPTILGICGSLRRGSFNAALLDAAAGLAPAGTTIEAASIRDVPIYDGDLEVAAFPDAVTRLKDALAAADALLLVSPEYNYSVPGALKNAIDWMTRPPADIPRVFRDKPVAVIGASTGRGGTRLAQTAWLPVFRTLGMRPWSGKELYVAEAAKVFGDGGALVDAKVRELLGNLIAGFAGFVAETARR